MRKFVMLVGLIVALAIPAVALAADFDPSRFGDLIGDGDDCALGADYHFVNVHTAGASAGTISVYFDNGIVVPANDVGQPDQLNQAASKVNSHNQHFLVFSTGTLGDAVSSLPGRLVLSDITCKKA